MKKIIVNTRKPLVLLLLNPEPNRKSIALPLRTSRSSSCAGKRFYVAESPADVAFRHGGIMESRRVGVGVPMRDDCVESWKTVAGFCWHIRIVLFNMPISISPGSNWTQATLTMPRSTKQEPSTPIEEDDFFYLPTFNDEAIKQVADMLTNTLREAKHRHLIACTEVLLPCELLQRIGVEMLASSDEEACGIRVSKMFRWNL